MKPLVIRRERIITLPVDVLWQFVEPADTLPAWLPFVMRSRQVSGKGLGRRQRASLRWGGGQLDVDQQVTTYQPNRAIGWKQVPGDRQGSDKPPDVTISVSMEPMGPGTRVVLEARLVPESIGELIRYRIATGHRVRAGFDRALRILAGVGG